MVIWIKWRSYRIVEISNFIYWGFISPISHAREKSDSVTFEFLSQWVLSEAVKSTIRLVKWLDVDVLGAILQQVLVRIWHSFQLIPTKSDWLLNKLLQSLTSTQFEVKFQILLNQSADRYRDKYIGSVLANEKNITAGTKPARSNTLPIGVAAKYFPSSLSVMKHPLNFVHLQFVFAPAKLYMCWGWNHKKVVRPELSNTEPNIAENPPPLQTPPLATLDTPPGRNNPHEIERIKIRGGVGRMDRWWC